METNVIICGEASKIMAGFEEGCIDLSVTSPPYDDLREYKGYTFDFEAIAQQLYRVTKPGGVVVWVVGDATVNGSETGTSFRQALLFKEIGFNLHDTMIWVKAGCSFSETNRYYPIYEFMFIFSKGKPTTFNLIEDRKNKCYGDKVRGTDRMPDGSTKQVSSKRNNLGRLIKEYGVRYNVWNINEEKNSRMFGHPAIFPEQLAADHIRSWSNEGDIVLDPMAGSGTTLKAARILGRKYIGIEISEEYVAIAEERLSQSVLDFK